MSRWLVMNTDTVEDICHQIDELIEGFALGALEPDEWLLVSEMIKDCPGSRERLREYEETVGLLGLAVKPVEPSRDLWARLDASTNAPAPAPGVAALPTPATRGLIVPRWAAALASVAAVLLLAATLSLGVALQQSRDDDDPVTDATVAEYLMAGGEMTQLSSWAAPEWMTWPGRGTLITAPDMPPIIIVDRCAPTVDTDWDYIVWLRIGDERTPMGLMEIGEDGKGVMQLTGIESLEQYDAIGISIRKSDSTYYDVMEGPPGQIG